MQIMIKTDPKNLKEIYLKNSDFYQDPECQKPLEVSLEDKLLKRLIYYRNWCVKHNRSFSFEVIFFEQDQGMFLQVHVRSGLIKKEKDEDCYKIVFYTSEAVGTSSIGRGLKLLDNVQEPVLVTEAEPIAEPGPRIIYANRAFEELTGFTAAEVIGKNPRILQGPDCSMEARAHLRAALETWKPVRQEIKNYKKNGEPFYTELNISPVCDETGWWSHWVSFQRDITKEKAHQASLQKLQEIGREGFWSLKVSNQETYWSSGVYRIFDLPEYSPLSLSESLTYYRAQDQKRIAACISNCYQQQKKFDETFEFKSATGNKKWVRLYGEPIVETNGEVFEICGIIQDVTQEVINSKAREEESKKSMIQSRLASIGELAAGVGHEINNPLAIAMGKISEIRETMAAGDQYQKDFEIIRKAHERIQNITKGLRNFSRADSSKHNFNLAEAIIESVNFIKDIYRSEGISVSLRFEAPQGLALKGSRGEFLQVLMNLISNAKDATDGMPIRNIDLMVENQADWVKILVSDNGTGIPQDIKDQVFDLFFTTKGVGKGTGMGLSLASQIVTSMGGKISFESSPDRGTTFSVELPISRETEQTISIKRAQPELLKSGLRILLAEDDVDLAEVVANMFIRLGCQVDTVGNGAEAYKLLLQKNYDFVFSDIHMPIMNGLELVSKIRSSHLPQPPAFILMTGGISEENLDTDSLKHIQGIIKKPFTAAGLAEIINKVLE